jgi:hypothetical protein
MDVTRLFENLIHFELVLDGIHIRVVPAWKWLIEQ